MFPAINAPPGLEGPLKEVVSGNHPIEQDRDWMTFRFTKIFTNAFIWSESSGKILLGYKKRGFGMGLYNGFGGKVEPDETAVQAAVRELKEESGIEAELTQCGTLLFYSEGSEFAYMIMLYTAKPEDCQTKPVETDEMRPEWFSIPQEYCSSGHENREQAPPIPFDTMWPDDELWFPLMLSRKLFAGRVDFAKLDGDFNEAKVVKWWFGTVE